MYHAFVNTLVLFRFETASRVYFYETLKTKSSTKLNSFEFVDEIFRRFIAAVLSAGGGDCRKVQHESGTWRNTSCLIAGPLYFGFKKRTAKIEKTERRCSDSNKSLCISYVHEHER